MRIYPITNILYGNLTNSNSANSASSVFQNNIISFNGTTSAGNPLRKLKNIVCPYFGVKTISGAELPRIEKRLDKCTNVKEVVKVLKPYSSYMQKTEKNIYKIFVENARKNPDRKLPEILQEHYDEALVKLKLEEFNVLDDVDKISLKLSPEQALAVHSQTTTCRQVIIDNKQDDAFKRKMLLSSLDELKPKRGEKAIFELLRDRAIYLPTSSSSENAFIVKYANRSQEEIAKRIIRVSRATIEHVKPNSKNGENALSNFMLVSECANSARSNMPLSKFIDRFPCVLKNCQKYINQIISIIHSGNFKGYETYPYKIKKTLAKESAGRIILDLSEYKYSEKEAKKVSQKKFNKTKRK